MLSITFRHAVTKTQMRAFSSPSGDSFMSAARVGGSAALMGLLKASGTRFDSCLSGLEITSVLPGRVVCLLTVTENLSNSYGTLHGGAAALIVDIAGTLAALSVDSSRPGVSVDMAQTFLRPAKIGERLYIVGTCLKSGKKLAFTDVEIRGSASADGPLLVVGRHTKAL